MDNADLMPTVLMRRIKELRKAGFKVTIESSEEGLLTLKITKNETNEGSKHYFFDF